MSDDELKQEFDRLTAAGSRNCFLLVIFMIVVAFLFGCAPAPSEAKVDGSAAAYGAAICGGGCSGKWVVVYNTEEKAPRCECVPKRKPRDTYCFRLAETCEWPKGPPADPICDEFCVKGVHKPKAPKK